MNFLKSLITRSILFGLLLLGLASRADAGFLYAMSDNSLSGVQIYGFQVNETTGALTPLAGFPLTTGLSGASNSVHERMAVDKLNKRLYVINAGSNRVTAYNINPTTGALTLFRTIVLPAGNYHSISVHPSGSPLLVANADTGAVASYNIVGTTATAAAGSPFSTGVVFPFSGGISANGNYYYVGGNSITDNRFCGFGVNPTTGVLTTLPGSPFNSGAATPIAYTADSAGRLFLANMSAGQLRVFTTTNGVPSTVTGNPFASGLTRAAFGLLHPNENFYVVADRSGNRVGSYRINGSGSSTTLTQVAGSPVSSGGTFTGSLAFNQTGTFLFAANSSTVNITTYGFNPTTGELNNINVQPPNTLGTSGGVTGMAYIESSAPTASSVSLSGQVLSQTGKGIGGARIVLTNPVTQETITAQTNPFGYYRFMGVSIGETYIFTISAKGYQFTPATQIRTIVDETEEINFVSDN